MHDDEQDTSPITLAASLEVDNCDRGDYHTQVAVSYDGAATVRIVGNEEGYEENTENRPLGWLNSARIVTDPDEDSVTCAVSVGDPRGAFCFTVRRLPDGRIVIHMPYPGEGMPHMETAALHPGTLVVK